MTSLKWIDFECVMSEPRFLSRNQLEMEIWKAVLSIAVGKDWLFMWLSTWIMSYSEAYLEQPGRLWIMVFGSEPVTLVEFPGFPCRFL